ncbi:hypothetical protein LJCM5344_10370 [Lactobacillus paragasseri]|uniref:hypothetical protein n=1 Tax=Lactobacillus paragasseri TaxID=2107999 RepID=UPI000DBC2EAA|nr:hypothetical protein [Lactobacillus paragasseri]GBA91289.1 hypothetical protein LJCM5344_10370 [Lactobacillus paragasseri]
MIKVMLILWYLFVGGLWLLLLAMIFSDAFETPFKKIQKQTVIEGIIPALFITIIFWMIALIPNFIGAVIQWIISLFH